MRHWASRWHQRTTRRCEPSRCIIVCWEAPTGRTGAGTSAFPIIAPTSHWAVQVGDYFYELRRKRDRSDDVLEDDGLHEPIDVQDEGDKVNLAITRDRIIVDGTKSFHVAETKLTDVQIRARAVYIFKRLFATDYNILI